MLRGWLPEHLEANDDLTLEGHREAFGEEVSTSTAGRAIAGLPDGGWPLKKVTGGPRARRGGEGSLAVARFPLRCQAAQTSPLSARHIAGMALAENSGA